MSDDLKDIQDYLKTGEIRSHLSMKAAMAVHSAETGWNRINPSLARWEQKWINVYALVYADVTAIQMAAKEFEFRHWMGFCEADVSRLMEEYRQWTYFDWEAATKEEGDRMRDKWNPHPKSMADYDEDNYWREHWQEHIDRRDKKPLQQIYDESPTFLSNHGNVLDKIVQSVESGAEFDDDAAFVATNLDVRLGGSAGRVLLTIQDKVDRKDAKNVFDGAWVSLIFDESSGWPRGGVQGHAARRDEAVGMIKAVSKAMPYLTQDRNLRIG